jgi:hypothetical protein
MQLLNADIVASARGLSIGAAGFLLFVGLLLWTCGWRWHKFWVVFGITTGAGLVGLNAGQSSGGQVLVLGILLAFAGGVMALEVAKLLAFAGGGLAAWLGVQAVVPQAHEMWAVFLAGGLLGVILYRLWTMLVTSLLGTLVAGHALLVLAVEWDLVTGKWIAANAIALNGAVIAIALFGIFTQSLIGSEGVPEEVEEKAEVAAKPAKESAKKSWWRLAA